MGAVILFPSLGLLFRLVLGGRFDPDHAEGASANANGESNTNADADGGTPAAALSTGDGRLAGRLALAGALGGLGLLTAAEAGWAHGVGVGCPFVAMLAAVVAVDPARLAYGEPGDPGELSAAGLRGGREHAGGAGGPTPR
jgi:cytochrome d ubiquinol oxidase subunit II